MGVLEFLWSQWNTLTAGGSKKLTVSQYHAIQDGIHIQDKNLEALKVSKLVGDVTNTRSSSGPIEGTAQLLNIESITNSLITAFKPTTGVWQLYAANIQTLDGASSMVLKLYDGSTQVVIDSGTSTSGEMELNEPVFFRRRRG